jgi:UDP-N-acetylglucosamine 1-carboxyvinyltransferase
MTVDDKSWLMSCDAPLAGRIEVAGAKNTVTKLMAAACLASGVSRLSGVPDIADVSITAAMLRGVGVGVAHEAGTLSLETEGLARSDIDLAYSGLNRVPILLLPILLHRFQHAMVPLAGGDIIGRRSINFHLDILRKMGASVTETDNGIEATGPLSAAVLELPYPSVGATETALLASVLAPGRTIIDNAAIEPEILELVGFLLRMGAVIELKAGRTFVVEGVPRLAPASQRVEGDRIEAFSYLAAALASRGEITVVGCSERRLVTAIALLRRLGAGIRVTDDGITASWTGALRSTAVATQPHPGFMTDWQPPLVALLTQASGVSAVHETVFEDRLGFTGELVKMGAVIDTYDQCLGESACRFDTSASYHSALIAGPAELVGSELVMPDIRAGFGLVVGAIAAHGQSLLEGVHHLERGYDNVAEKLSSVGCEIKSSSR